MSRSPARGEGQNYDVRNPAMQLWTRFAGSRFAGSRVAGSRVAGSRVAGSRRLLMPLHGPQSRGPQYSSIFHCHRRPNYARQVRPFDVQIPQFVNVLLGHRQGGSWSLKTHESGDVTNECVTIVKNSVPDRRLVLQLLDERCDLLVFGFIQHNTEACEHILVLGVTVAWAYLRRHKNNMSDHPGDRALGKWMQARHLGRNNLPLRVYSSIYRERVAIALRGTRPKLDEIVLSRLRSDFGRACTRNSTRGRHCNDFSWGDCDLGNSGR